MNFLMVSAGTENEASSCRLRITGEGFAQVGTWKRAQVQSQQPPSWWRLRVWLQMHRVESFTVNPSHSGQPMMR